MFDLGNARRVLDGVPDGLVVSDAGGIIVLVNGALERMFGYARHELEGAPLERLMPERYRGDHAPHVSRFLGAPQVRSMGGALALFGVRKDGAEFPVEISISPMCVDDAMVIVGAIRDVTERRSVEAERDAARAQLTVAQRMSAIGALAAGVAHEINTPVQFVSDSLHFLQAAADDVFGMLDPLVAVLDAAARSGDPSVAAQVAAARAALVASDLDYLREHVPAAFARCVDGLARVSTIVRSMKEFAHPTHEDMAPADLNRAIVSTLVVAATEYKYVAEIETELGELPAVTCNIGELNQVVLNLLVNAAHAVGDRVKASGERGRITIRTRLDGEHVQVSISDTGTGIPDDVRLRIFEPFYTTKEVGRGTGQGLALAWKVITADHGGQLTVETVLGEGTTFHIRLPIAGKGLVAA